MKLWKRRTAGELLGVHRNVIDVKSTAFISVFRGKYRYKVLRYLGCILSDPYIAQNCVTHPGY